ncbi:MAG TPA: hypothetical protein VJT73_17795 [Polyangiaceae bacterium]|nr:hypothetical protein [Polyangiaceae bacterium]
MVSRSVAGTAAGALLWASALAQPSRASAAERSFLDAPPPAPPPEPPEPAREAEEFARRAWEVFPQIGLAAPFCRGGTAGLGQCGNTESGAAFGGGALYRLSPHVGLGLEASAAGFRFEVPGAPLATSAVTWVGLVARGYFLDHGMFDPYVEAGVGRGSGSAAITGGPSAFRLETSGPSAMAGVGLDFWMTTFFRTGPALSYRWTWLTDVRACVDDACQRIAASEAGAVGSDVRFSLHATLAFGGEM